MEGSSASGTRARSRRAAGVAKGCRGLAERLRGEQKRADILERMACVAERSRIPGGERRGMICARLHPVAFDLARKLDEPRCGPLSAAEPCEVVVCEERDAEMSSLEGDLGRGQRRSTGLAQCALGGAQPGSAQLDARRVDPRTPRGCV